jgi:WD40 repeat protein
VQNTDEYYRSKTVVGAYDLDLATFTTSLQTGGTRIRDLAFNDTGTLLHDLDTTNGTIFRFTLSTPFDIGTGSFDTSVSVPDKSCTGIEFNNDGTKMFIGNFNGDIDEYDLQTPFDVTQKTQTNSLDVGLSRDVIFNDDGSKLYNCRDNNNTIEVFNLPTAFDLTGANKINTISSEPSPEAIDFNGDGTLFYQSAGGTVFQFETGSPYDISNLTLATTLNAQTGFAPGITFNNDGTRFYECSSNAPDAMHQYDINTSGGWIQF